MGKSGTDGSSKDVNLAVDGPEVPLVMVSTQGISVWNKVPDSYGNRAMPCILSPLGFHVPAPTKEKIWHGEYMDILALLPS